MDILDLMFSKRWQDNRQPFFSQVQYLTSARQAGLFANDPLISIDFITTSCQRRHWNDTSCHDVTGTMRCCLKPSHFLAELLGLVDYDIACPNWYDLLCLNGLNGFDWEVDDGEYPKHCGSSFDHLIVGQKVKTQKHVFFATTSQFGKDSEGYSMIYHHMSSSHVIDMS